MNKLLMYDNIHLIDTSSPAFDMTHEGHNIFSLIHGQ